MGFLGCGSPRSSSSSLVLPASSIFSIFVLALLLLGVGVGVACSYIVRNIDRNIFRNISQEH